MICVRCGKDNSVKTKPMVCEKCGFNHGDELCFIFSLDTFEISNLEIEDNRPDKALNDKYIKYGTKTYINGSKYEGGLLNGKRHGFGILISVDGDKYEGEYKNGLEHGQGIFT